MCVNVTILALGKMSSFGGVEAAAHCGCPQSSATHHQDLALGQYQSADARTTTTSSHLHGSWSQILSRYNHHKLVTMSVMEKKKLEEAHEHVR